MVKIPSAQFLNCAAGQRFKNLAACLLET